MSKGGFLTPKAIANRIKAKGLQKLKWYCQMCNKQCRDENGFKCHQTSEAHQRQLLLFADNPNKYVGDFSHEFSEGYMDLMKRQFGGKRVSANVIYQEYIKERDHIHMNSTRWHTLSGFVQWLGKKGLARVDNTEKGWFVEYIDRDPLKIQRQEKLEKMDATEDEKMNRFLERQIERDRSRQEVIQTEYTELKRENEEEKITLKLATGPATSTDSKPLPQKNALLLAAKKIRDNSDTVSVASSNRSTSSQKRKAPSALDEIREAEEREKEKKNRRDYWLHPGIVVKVVTKRLGEKYHNKKAVVEEVVQNYTAVIKFLDSGEKMKVDQDHVQTVIPAIGRKVLIVNGAYRGCEAILLSIQEEKFSCKVDILSGLCKGRKIDSIMYEDVSKIHVEG